MTLLNSPQFWLNVARLATLIFTAFIAFMTYQSYQLLTRYKPNFNVLLSLPESIARIVMVLICLFIAWMSGLSRAELGLTVDHLWWSIAVGLGVGIVIQLTINIVTVQAVNRYGSHIYLPWLVRNILPSHRSQWIWLALAFIPPVAMEELLFRTLWVGLFQDVIPLAILISGTSLVFGLMHGPQGKLGMIVTGTINAIFCLLFVWSGELLVTLVAHYTVNMLQLITAHFQRDWLDTL